MIMRFVANEVLEGLIPFACSNNTPPAPLYNANNLAVFFRTPMSINEEIEDQYKLIADLETQLQEVKQSINDAKIHLQSLLHANSYIREHSGESSIVP